MAGYKLQGKTLEGNMVDIPLVATYDSDGNNIAEKFKVLDENNIFVKNVAVGEWVHFIDNDFLLEHKICLLKYPPNFYHDEMESNLPSGLKTKYGFSIFIMIGADEASVFFRCQDFSGNVWEKVMNSTVGGNNDWHKVGDDGSSTITEVQYYDVKKTDTFDDISSAIKSNIKEFIALFPTGFDLSKLTIDGQTIFPSDFIDFNNGAILTINMNNVPPEESQSGNWDYNSTWSISNNQGDMWYGSPSAWKKIATTDDLSNIGNGGGVEGYSCIRVSDKNYSMNSYGGQTSEDYFVGQLTFDMPPSGASFIGMRLTEIMLNINGENYRGQGVIYPATYTSPTFVLQKIGSTDISVSGSYLFNCRYDFLGSSLNIPLLKARVYDMQGNLVHLNSTDYLVIKYSILLKSDNDSFGGNSGTNIKVNNTKMKDISFIKDPQSQITDNTLKIQENQTKITENKTRVEKIESSIEKINNRTHIISSQNGNWLDNLPNEPGVDTYIFTAGDYYTNDNNFWMETSGEINHNPFILKITTIEPGDSWKTGRRIWEFTSMNYESDGQRYIWSQHDLNSIGDASISWKGGKPNWQKVATIDGSYASANISRLVKSMNDIDLGKDPYSTVSLILFPGVTVFDNSLIPYLPEDYDTTVCGVLTANAITFMFSLTDANKNRWEGYLDEKTNTITWNKLASASEITNLKNELDSIKHNKTQIKSRTYELTMSASSNDANVWFYCDDVNIDNAIGCEIEFTTQDKTRGFKGTAGVPDFSGSSVSSFDNVLGTFVGVELNNNNNFTWWSTVGTCTTTLDGATHRALNIRSVKAHCKTLTNNDSEYRDYTGITNGRCKLTILYCE